MKMNKEKNCLDRKCRCLGYNPEEGLFHCDILEHEMENGEELIYHGNHCPLDKDENIV